MHHHHTYFIKEDFVEIIFSSKLGRQRKRQTNYRSAWRNDLFWNEFFINQSWVCFCWPTSNHGVISKKNRNDIRAILRAILERNFKQVKEGAKIAYRSNFDQMCPTASAMKEKERNLERKLENRKERLIWRRPLRFWLSIYFFQFKIFNGEYQKSRTHTVGNCKTLWKAIVYMAPRAIEVLTSLTLLNSTPPNRSSNL